MNENNNAKETIIKYFKILKDAKADAVVELYSQNGVFMPADLPSSTGKDALLKAYDQTFKAIKFVSINSNYDEVSVHGDIAIIRTTTEGHFFLLNEKLDVKTKMREFFILNKENEEWKISRYMFNKIH